jgi:hypothetical protein
VLDNKAVLLLRHLGEPHAAKQREDAVAERRGRHWTSLGWVASNTRCARPSRKEKTAPSFFSHLSGAVVGLPSSTVTRPSTRAVSSQHGQIDRWIDRFLVEKTRASTLRRYNCNVSPPKRASTHRRLLVDARHAARRRHWLGHRVLGSHTTLLYVRATILLYLPASRANGTEQQTTSEQKEVLEQTPHGGVDRPPACFPRGVLHLLHEDPHGAYQP